MLRPQPVEPVPIEAMRIAQAAFPKGHRQLQLADADYKAIVHLDARDLIEGEGPPRTNG